MAPKQESTGAGNSDMPKRSCRTHTGNFDVPKSSCKVLPLSEKVKPLDLIKKEKAPMLRLLRSTVRTHLLPVKL